MGAVLRNHDELTLEMVTDEERDYMYRVYANDAKARINLGIRRRLAPLMGNDRKRIELLKLLLFSLPGTPVLYYGDEIGMGDNVFLGDRNSVRTPMQWSSDRNAGFSRANPQSLYFPVILDPEYHYEAVNVETQQRNPNSLFWWMKQTLTLRKRYKAFGRGSLAFLQPENRKVLAFIRRWERETILVVANLSRFPQPVRLDLSEFAGTAPVELFGRAHFPAITAQPYLLTLSPHAAFWFALEPVVVSEPPAVSGQVYETLVVPESWEDLLHADWRAGLENCLLLFLKRRGRSSRQGRAIQSVRVLDAIGMPMGSRKAFMLVLSLEDVEGDSEECQLLLASATGVEAEQLEQTMPRQIIARLRRENATSQDVLYAAARSPAVCGGLLEAMARRRTFSGEDGELKTLATAALRTAGNDHELAALSPVFGTADHRNAAVIFGERYFLKLYRRLEAGVNPDLEIGRFLTEREFPNIRPVAGWLEYRRSSGDEFTVGVLTRYLREAQDAWTYTVDMLGRYFERVRTAPEEIRREPAGDGSLLTCAEQEVPETVVGLIGTYLELARLLGQRTGELHLALASEPQHRDFAPEPFTPFYQRSLFQSMRNLTVHNLQRLRRSPDRIPEALRAQASQVAGLESEILKRLRAVATTTMAAKRIRCHGDCHLGEVLYTGKDFIFIDFEGEPARSLGERRIKRSPLRDVAAMVRSFDYVALAALYKHIELGRLQKEQILELEPWTTFWSRWVGAVYLKAYLQVLGSTDLLPAAKEPLAVLLEAHLLEKTVYEVGYELANRPNWLGIPLRGILHLLGRTKQDEGE